MEAPDLTKLCRTDFQMAMLDDSATYHGWVISDKAMGGYPSRQYSKDDRAVWVSFYDRAGVADARIKTFGPRWFSPVTDKVSEIMAELCATEDETEWHQ